MGAYIDFDSNLGHLPGDKGIKCTVEFEEKTATLITPLNSIRHGRRRKAIVSSSCLLLGVILLKA